MFPAPRSPRSRAGQAGRNRVASLVPPIVVAVLLWPGAGAPLASGEPPGQAGFRRPLPGGEVSRPFAPPTTAYGPGHRGIDLPGAAGAPVSAAGSGVVLFAGPLAGRPLVSVQHPGGLRTTYEPVRPVVEAGQRVAAGQLIGLLAPGHPGCAVPACLHWGALRGEVYLDPMALLGGVEVRLLPWD
ncbi:M23 family metallopeptidase [Saccharopolyspora sp. MS10]|uniref:M23 family metallopeptidase n=1 Tax=Saccharopolyspora sp. MS10 TaxID=3385973 RepID=UPI00399FD112